MGTNTFQLIEAPTAPEDLIPDPASAPQVALRSLDVLWIQVTGTLCNIQCSHCFISCGPANHDLEIMPRAQIQDYLREALELGVKEYYFTGGEPFLHREMVEILEDALQQGDVTVLTNGMLLKEATVARLKAINATSPHSLTCRVSIDGFDAETNDAIRGPGAFDQALEGLLRLSKAGFVPIVTATRTWPCDQETRVVENFNRALARVGIQKVVLKILPNLKIGREAKRDRAYAGQERVTQEMLCGYDTSNLVCSHARVVTDRGVRVCPILVGAEDATMGQTLKESLGAYPLRHRVCHTCWSHGAICSNATGCTEGPAEPAEPAGREKTCG